MAPRAEASVTERAGDLKIAAYYPTGVKYVRSRRRRVVVMVPRPVPAMPGYVFVQGEHFANFRRDFDANDAVPNCIGWLSGQGGPVAVNDNEVAEIKRRASAGEFDAIEAQGRYWAPRWLKPRAKVRVVLGPLKDQVGEVWRLSAARRVQLWLRMLGEMRLVEFDVDALARAR